MFNNNNNLKRSVGSLERYAFDNFDSFDPEMNYDAASAEDPSFYDDEESFDPEMYDLPDGYAMRSKQAKKSRIKSAPLAQLDITIDNGGISARTTVELFNVLRSNTLIRNTAYNATTYEPQVFDKSVNRAAANSSIMNDAQMIYWRSDGSLVYNAASAATGTTLATNTCVISCPQVPFRVLHEATRSNLLWIEKIRLVVPSGTLSQIDEPITIFKNTFLGGKKENQIAPRSEFKPNQFQTNIVDVPIKSAIDAETGMSYTLVSQSKVTMSLFFRFVRGNEYMVNQGF
jgi:hypothetical protein